MGKLDTPAWNEEPSIVPISVTFIRRRGNGNGTSLESVFPSGPIDYRNTSDDAN